VGGVPAGGVNQIQVDCGDAGKGCPSKEFNVFRFGCGKKEPAPRAKIQNRLLTTTPVVTPGGLPQGGTEFDPKKMPTPGGGMQGAAVGPTPSPTPAIINQPIFNQPAAPLTPSVPPFMPPSKED
jgi:hypothetical protein